MQDNISPEERLLRLIRRKRSKPLPKEEKKNKNTQVDQTQKARPRISLPTFSFELLSRILLMVLLILGICLLLDFLLVKPKKIDEIKSDGPQVLDKIPVAQAPLEPLSYYTESVKSINLFTASSQVTEQTQPSPTFMQMVSSLKLQGIVSGPSPQAIIEDIKAKQVYFLSPGDYIGEIKLKEIFPGRVKLEYYGQVAELSL